MEIEVSDTKTSWLKKVKTESPELQAYFKGCPGVRRIRSSIYHVPIDVVAFLRKEERAEETETIDGLYPYQQQAVNRTLEDGAHIFGFDTGLGKTRAAIELCKRLKGSRALIITLKSVRKHWGRELAKWQHEDLDIGLITAGRNIKSGTKLQKQIRAKAYAAQIQIVSYQLLHHVDTSGWDCIIFDELHLIKSPSAKISRVAESLVAANPQAKVCGLTATFLPDTPLDAFGQLHVLWPGRFGRLNKNRQRSHEFCMRYCDRKIPGEYGWEFSGVDSTFQPELQFRLNYVMTRATKEQWSHLLPSMFCTVRYLDPPKSLDLTELIQLDPEKYFGRLEEHKIGPAIDWAQDTMHTTSHVCILTWHKHVAHKIAAHFGVKAVTSEFTAGRDEYIQGLRSQDKALLVGTIGALGTGIELPEFKQVLFAELWWRVSTMTQALGRFQRLSSDKENVHVELLVLDGTIDEKVALALQQKIEDNAKLLDNSLADKHIAESLIMSDEDMFAELAAL